ncbi:MAG: hypothetical protein LBG24_11880 [Treponema sp.]|jgi:hypothetical protein|nr:hypothetical protein [Treponema sp.]
MTVSECTVSDSNGAIDTAAYVGTIVTKNGAPFTFYIRGTENQPQEVKIIMPLGGTQAGLFRYPRVGEKVLVGVEGASRYLMGYIPTNLQDFETAGMAQGNGRGEVFRYQQTGKTRPPEGEAYSEIGFSHEQTSWIPADADLYCDIQRDQNKAPTEAPKIDRIHIHSTGDIHESAVNHHQVKARRLELLSEGDKALAPSDPGAFQPGDIKLKAGADITLDAANITLQAGKSITLKVGRTSLTISDTGFSVTSQMMQRYASPFDASFSLGVRDGIALSGQTVDISGRRKWSVSDKLGGAVSSTAGVLNLAGRDITIGTIQKEMQIVNNFTFGIDYSLALVSGSIGNVANAREHNAEQLKADMKAYLILKAIYTWANFVNSTLYGLYIKYQTNQKKLGKMEELETALKTRQEFLREERMGILLARDYPGSEDPRFSPGDLFTFASLYPPFARFALALDMILDIANCVYKQVEKNSTFDAQTRDIFNFATLAIDNGFITTFASLMTTQAAAEGTAAMSLGFDGSVTVKAAKDQSFYAVTKKEGAASGPMIATWVKSAMIAGSVPGKVTDVINRITTTIDLAKQIDNLDVTAEKEEL